MNTTRSSSFPNAIFSPFHEYRFALTRYWGPADPVFGKCNIAVWIGLNPSKANETDNDPTMNQIIGFSERWGYDGCVVVNLFAKVETQSKILTNMDRDEAVGPNNDQTIKALCHGKPVYVAWGNRGRLHGRDKEVIRILADAGAELRCLGLTKKGYPRHPLYVPLRTDARPFRVD